MKTSKKLLTSAMAVLLITGGAAVVNEALAAEDAPSTAVSGEEFTEEQKELIDTYVNKLEPLTALSKGNKRDIIFQIKTFVKMGKPENLDGLMKQAGEVNKASAESNINDQKPGKEGQALDEKTQEKPAEASDEMS